MPRQRLELALHHNEVKRAIVLEPQILITCTEAKKQRLGRSKGLVGGLRSREMTSAVGAVFGAGALTVTFAGDGSVSDDSSERMKKLLQRLERRCIYGRWELLMTVREVLDAVITT